MIVIMFTLWMYERNMRSVRDAAAGKHVVRAIVDMACGVIRASKDEQLSDDTMYKLLETTPIAGDVRLMLLRPNGDVLLGADWGVPGEQVNVMSLRTRTAVMSESVYEQLIAKAMAGGGYVTYRVRDEHNARRAVTVYGRAVGKQSLIVCARRMHSG